MCSPEQAHHQNGGNRHTFITDTGVQYGGGTSSKLMRMCSTEEAHHQHGRGYVVQICHMISTDEDMHYRTTKTVQGVWMVVFIWEDDILHTILL